MSISNLLSENDYSVFVNDLTISKLPALDLTNSNFLVRNGTTGEIEINNNIVPGDVSDGANLGVGAPIFHAKSGSSLQFNSLAANGAQGFSITPAPALTGGDITINNTFLNQDVKKTSAPSFLGPVSIGGMSTPGAVTLTNTALETTTITCGTVSQIPMQVIGSSGDVFTLNDTGSSENFVTSTSPQDLLEKHFNAEFGNGSYFYSNTGANRLLKFNCSGGNDNTSTTIRTTQSSNINVSMPNTGGTLALTSQIPTNLTYVDLTTNQTIASGIKTFVNAPVMSSISNGGGNLTIPSGSNTTFATIDTAQTFTNKTITNPTIDKITNINVTNAFAGSNPGGVRMGLQQGGSSAVAGHICTYATSDPTPIISDSGIALSSVITSNSSPTLNNPTFTGGMTSNTPVFLYNGSTSNETQLTTAASGLKSAVFPNASGNIVIDTATQTITTKTIDSANNTINVNGTNINSLINQDVRSTASPTLSQLTLTTGVLLPTTGGTATNLNYYESFSTTHSWSGPWASPIVANVVYIRTGTAVTMYFQRALGTPSIAAVATSDAVPARFRPSATGTYATNFGFLPVFCINSTVGNVGYMLYNAGTTSWNVYPSQASVTTGAGFSTSGTTNGFVEGAISYHV